MQDTKPAAASMASARAAAALGRPGTRAGGPGRPAAALLLPAAGALLLPAAGALLLPAAAGERVQDAHAVALFHPHRRNH